MVCFLQLALAALAAWVLWVPAVRVAGRVVGRPHTIFVGLILLGQLPLAFLAGAAAGAAEELRAVRDGELPPDPKKVQKKYAWIDSAVIGMAVAAAVACGLSGLKRDEPTYTPPEPIAGVRDLVSELERRKAAEEAEAEVWRGVPDPAEVEPRYRE